MALLHPIELDRYVLYLDQVVYVAGDDQDPSRYKAVFSDGDRLTFPKTLKQELDDKLPSSFLRYEEMWINDLFLKYLDRHWSEAQQKTILLTKFLDTTYNITAEYAGDNRVAPLTRDVSLVTSNDTLELGAPEVLETIMTTRKDTSTKALVTTRSDVMAATTPMVTSRINAAVNKAIQEVKDLLASKPEEDDDMSDMGIYYNELIGASDDD